MTTSIWHLLFPADTFGDQEIIVYGTWGKAFTIAAQWLDTHYPNGWQFVTHTFKPGQFQNLPIRDGRFVPLQIDEITQVHLERLPSLQKCKVIA